MYPLDPETEALLVRARRGDRSAVEELLARYRARLRRMVAMRMDHRLSARIDPSDVVQESLSVAYKRLSGYLEKPVVPFYVWLRQIAWNCLLDLHRHHILAGKRSVDREDPLRLSSTSVSELAEHFLGNGRTPIKQLLQQEVCARLHAGLERLSDRHREILLLRYVEQLSGAECAAVLDISENAAKQLHLRAIRQLHRLLGRELLGGSQ